MTFIKARFRLWIILAICACLSSCEVLPDHLGFYAPMSLKLTVPDGPPEYKAGWYAGCRSGLSIKRFSNASVFQDSQGVYFGNGVYQHDPHFQNGWAHGWFSCVIHTGTYDSMPGGILKAAPLL